MSPGKTTKKVNVNNSKKGDEKVIYMYSKHAKENGLQVALLTLRVHAFSSMFEI
jgi:hypothetical protein